MKEQTNSLWFSFYSLNPFQGINKWIADCVSSLTSIEKRKAKSLQGQETHKCKNIVVATLWCVFTEKVNQKREGKILNMLVVPFLPFSTFHMAFKWNFFHETCSFWSWKTLLLKASNNRPISQSWTWYGTKSTKPKRFSCNIVGRTTVNLKTFWKRGATAFFCFASAFGQPTTWETWRRQPFLSKWGQNNFFFSSFSPNFSCIVQQQNRAEWW